MTIQDLFENMIDKYGDNFNWMIIPFSNKSFADELNKELGENKFTHPIYAVAKCESNDDVLFLIDENDYRIYHLTYSKNNIEGYPRFLSFEGRESAIKYIEKEYVENYL